MAHSIDLAQVLAAIRSQAVQITQGGWVELGDLLDATLPDPLNPFVLLPIATGIAAEGNLEALIPAAAAVVLVDTALRIVDDCVDGDTPYALYHTTGMGRAMNVAMALNTLAIRQLSHLEHPASRLEGLVNHYFLSFLRVCEGQDRDIKAPATTLAQYQEIVQHKTVAAYEFTAMIGAYVASTDVDIIARCSLCGVHLGWMAQIFNDIVGLWFPETANDKEIKKMTFPVHLALSLRHPKAPVLEKMYREQNYNRAQILTLLDEMDVRPRLMTEALDHRDKAIAALGSPLNSEGQIMLQHWLNWLLRDGMDMLGSGT